MIQLEKFKIKNFLYFILYFSVCFQFFNDVFGVPSFFRYLVDLLLLAISVYIIIAKRSVSIISDKFYYIWFVLYLFFLILAYFINYQSVAYLLFGLKNNLRYFIFFFLCLELFREEDVKNILGFVEKIFYLNFIVVLIEYLVFHLRGDYLGGIFGISKGSNGFLNVLLVVYSIIMILRYTILKDIRLSVLGVNLCMIVVVSALCELKIMFFELAIIFIIVLLRSGVSIKKIILFVVGILAMYLGYEYMIGLFEYSENVFSIEGFLEYTFLRGYTSSSLEFNRLNFIKTANTYVLDTPLERAIGLGVGNCDYSNISFFMTPFYQKYKNLHYTWFMTSFTYLEQGAIGLLLYISFFVFYFIRIKKLKEVASYYCRLGEIMSVMAIVLVIYNQSMREDMAFLVYFILAIPLILSKKLGVKIRKNI